MKRYEKQVKTVAIIALVIAVIRFLTTANISWSFLVVGVLLLVNRKWSFYAACVGVALSLINLVYKLSSHTPLDWYDITALVGFIALLVWLSSVKKK